MRLLVVYSPRASLKVVSETLTVEKTFGGSILGVSFRKIVEVSTDSSAGIVVSLNSFRMKSQMITRSSPRSSRDSLSPSTRQIKFTTPAPRSRLIRGLVDSYISPRFLVFFGKWITIRPSATRSPLKVTYSWLTVLYMAMANDRWPPPLFHFLSFFCLFFGQLFFLSGCFGRFPASIG